MIRFEKIGKSGSTRSYRSGRSVSASCIWSIAELAHPLVDGGDGEHVAVPLRVAQDVDVLAVADDPIDPEPPPFEVMREALDRIAHPAADRDVGLAVVEHPVPAAHEHVDVARHPGELGHDLDSAGAGADHGDALAGGVDVAVPAGGVDGRAGERVEPGDVRVLRPVAEAAGVDQHVDAFGHDLPVRPSQPHLPRLAGLVVGGGDERRREPCPAAQIVVLGDGGEVLAHLPALGLEVRPVRPLGERERVEVAGRVHTDARIRVGVPRARQVGVALDDHRLVARLDQADRGRDPGQAEPDHHHPQVVRPFGPSGPLDAWPIRTQTDLVVQERHELVGDGLADADLHHPPQQLGGGLRHLGCDLTGQHRVHLRPQLGRQIRRDVLRPLQQHPLQVRGEAIQHRLVVGEVHVAEQQRRDLGVVQRLVQPGVVGERQRRALAEQRRVAFGGHRASSPAPRCVVKKSAIAARASRCLGQAEVVPEAVRQGLEHDQLGRHAGAAQGAMHERGGAEHRVGGCS